MAERTAGDVSPVVRPVYRARVVVSMEQARTVEAAKLDLAPLEEDLGVDLQVQAVYADPRLQRILVGEPELFRWFTVTTPEGMSSNDLTRHVRESRDRLKVRRVQPDLPAGDPQVGDNGAPITQGHLEQWPRGLGVIPARERVDGAFEFGEGVGLIDIEQGWTFDHQELGLEAGAALLFGRVEPASRQHGTADLAIVRGLGGSRLRAGIAPAVGPVAAASHSGSVVNVAPAIAFAIDQLQCGDVLMLQVQTDESCQGPCGIPAEWLPVVAEQVERATRKGITTVAAAGNGGQALDDLRDENGIAVFDRTQRDTLAILVGAGDSNEPHERLPSSCYGERVDCYAWGRDVVTAWSTDWGSTSRYTGAFDGTSAATAMVAGVAAAAQTICMQAHGAPLTPQAMRRVLTDSGAGTDHPGLGVMPNLERVLDILQTRPPPEELCPGP